MPASDEQVRTAIESYVRLVGGGTGEEIVALFADDATVEDPVGSDVRRGREQLLEFYVGLGSLKRSARMLDAKVVAGHAAFSFELTIDFGEMTQKITPIDVMTFDDAGRITSMRAYWSAADAVTL